MAGARPSSFKAGGGFLNNVDGVIADYEFTGEFPGGGGKKPGKKGSDFNPLYFLLTVQVDGADDPSTTTLFVGSADDFEIDRGWTEKIGDVTYAQESGNRYLVVKGTTDSNYVGMNFTTMPSPPSPSAGSVCNFRVRVVTPVTSIADDPRLVIMDRSLAEGSRFLLSAPADYSLLVGEMVQGDGGTLYPQTTFDSFRRGEWRSVHFRVSGAPLAAGSARILQGNATTTPELTITDKTVAVNRLPSVLSGWLYLGTRDSNKGLRGYEYHFDDVSCFVE